MMTLVGCLVLIVLFATIVFYALYQRRDVKAGLKIPFVMTLFFEASEHDKSSLKVPQTKIGSSNSKSVEAPK